MTLLRAGKTDGLPISVGVTPHHLYLEAADRERLGGFAMVKPPLKTRADREALWAAVADGTVDTIESDHAPHTRAEKASQDPPFGLPGLETTLPLMVLAMRERGLAEQRLIELLATNAQRLFSLVLPPGTYTLVDLDASYVISDDELRCSPGWSPYSGMRVWGRVREVRIRDRIAFDGERVLAAPGDGRHLLP
jgi:carbamoyl-phosphate synthase/aspartate carbamoyltransferase/dihydroorotase